MTHSNGFLFAFDFDNTAFNTATASVDGVTVAQAYERSVMDIFGRDGVEVFREIGGLGNRAPSELVQTMLVVGKNRGLNEAAHAYYREHHEDLLAVVPVHKGVAIDSWDELRKERIMTEMLVRRKLQILVPQIGSRDGQDALWPPPCNGFTEFWWRLEDLQKEGVPIRTAIISSGHDAFIEQTWQLWKLSKPDYMVTEDDIRGRVHPADMSRRVKPGLLQFALVHRLWLSDLGYTGRNFDYEVALQTRNRMMYFGDDPVKDGLLAQKAGIPFGHFFPEVSFAIDEKSHIVRFGDWRDMGNFMTEHGREFSSEGSMSDILFRNRGSTYPEVAPHPANVERY